MPNLDCPKFSIVIPAFNASASIKRTIDSVISQSFSDWEIIVCDDASSDNTSKIVSQISIADKRVHLLCSEINSGHAFTPRMKAIERAQGKYIVQLDADDILSPDYLLKLSHRIDATDADVVFCKMEVIDALRGVINSISYPNHLKCSVILGNEALLLTLYKWQVSGLGAIRKELYFKGLQELDSSDVRSLIYSDEILIRCILLYADKVAFADGVYYYNFNTDSVTHITARSYYERAIRDNAMLRILERHFQFPSQQWILANRKNACQLIECLQLLVKSNPPFPLSQKNEMDAQLKKLYNEINLKHVKKSSSPRIYALLKLGYVPAKKLLWLNERIKR